MAVPLWQGKASLFRKGPKSKYLLLWLLSTYASAVTVKATAVTVKVTAEMTK